MKMSETLGGQDVAQRGRAQAKVTQIRKRLENATSPQAV
jgi:hypothetical protein